MLSDSWGGVSFTCNGSLKNHLARNVIEIISRGEHPRVCAGQQTMGDPVKEDEKGAAVNRCD